MRGHVALVDDVDSKACLDAINFASDEVDSHVMLKEVDVGVLHRTLEQRTLNLSTGEVSCVHNPAV